MATETPVFFDCFGDRLLGVLHDPDGETGDVGVLVVVGGPQYRVGSHRQFVLLARHLAAAGIPTFRFDYRGMGDSAGSPRDFEDIGDDIRCGMDAFFANHEGLRGVVLWGLCDAATANAFYAATDSRVIGQIALNPWVRTAEGEARAFIRHYYPRRALSGSFWLKVASLRYDLASAAKDFLAKLRHVWGIRERYLRHEQRPLPQRLRDAQLAFDGPTLLILSGQDMTAKEYELRVGSSPEWQHWLENPRVEVQRLAAADHTFSSADWVRQVSDWCSAWTHRLSA